MRQRRVLALLVTLTLVGAVLGSFASSAIALPQNFFGLQFGNGYAANEQYPESEANMEAIARSGAKYWRLSFNCYEKNWTKYDREVRLAWEHGISIIANPSARCGEASVAVPPEGEWSAQETWLRELVQHYGWNGSFWAGKSNVKPITVWEIWNEPNLGEHGEDGVHADGSYYGRFLKSSAIALNEKQNSQATCCGINVLMGGLLTVGSGSDGKGHYNKNVHEFLEETHLVSGLDSRINGVAIHPYGFDPGAGTKVEEYIKKDREDASEFVGTEKSLWITEVGWPVEHEFAVSSARQSELLTTIFNWVKEKQASDNIQSLIYYNYRDFTFNGSWITACGLRERPQAEQFGHQTFRSSWGAFQKEAGASQWPVSPGAETSAATNVGPTSATLNGTINPHGLPTGYHFEWAEESEGFSHSIPSSDIEAGWKEGVISVHQELTGLKPGTTYHFRIVGANENNEQTGGANLSFKTLPLSRPAAISVGGTLELYTRNPSNHLIETAYESGSWHSWDVTAHTGSQIAGNPVILTEPGWPLEIYYRDPSNHLIETVYESGSWSSWDVTASTGSQIASDPAIMAKPGWPLEIYYRNPSNHLIETAFESGWHSWDVTASTGSQIAGDPAILTESGWPLEVYYQDPSNHLIETVFESGWSSWDITASTGSLVAGDPAVWAKPGWPLEIYYRNPSNHLIETVHESSWGSWDTGGGEVAG